MILCEWVGPEGNPELVGYTCMLSYPIVVSQLSFNFLCLLLLYSIYLCGLVGDIPDGNGKIANLFCTV
jgi:hypothetical protein